MAERIPQTYSRTGADNLRTGSVLIALGFAAALLAVSPAIFWDGGLLEKEALDFIPQYLDQRSIPEKVFDPRANDYGDYQARELSYFLDLLDAHWFMLLLNQGIVLFMPATVVIAWLVALITFQFSARRIMPQLDPTISSMVLLLYLTNYVYVVTIGVYYRATKPILASVLIIMSLYLVELLKHEPPDVNRRRSGLRVSPELVVFVISCLMSALDRQGFFYAVLMLAILLVYRIRGTVRSAVVWASAAAICVMLLYNILLAPWIVNAANGYWPDFKYQRLPVGDLVKKPEHALHAVQMLIESVRVLVGGLPGWIYLLAGVVGVGWVWLVVERGPGDRDGSGLVRRLLQTRRLGIASLGSATFLGSQIVMFALMIVRHPPVWEFEDHRIWYYPLPFQAIAAVGLLLLLNKLCLELRGGGVLGVKLLLVGLVASNVLGWAGHRDTMLRSRWFPEIYHQSALLKESLRARKQHPQLNARYAKFFNYVDSTMRYQPAQSDGARDRRGA